MRSSVKYTVATVVLVMASIPCAAVVNEYWVGPNGQYSTVSAALAALLASPESDNWIKVQAGVTTTEHLTIPAWWSADQIWLSGGWDPSFSAQSGNPADTVLSGGLGGRVIDVAANGGGILVSDLSIVDGWSNDGGGLRIRPTGDAHIRLDNLAIHDNSAPSSATAAGGAISATLDGDTSLVIDHCVIRDNAANSYSGSSARGGAVDAALGGNAELRIVGSEIRDNLAVSDSQVFGGAVALTVDDYAVASLTDCRVEGNTASSSAAITVDGSALAASVMFYGDLVIERTRFAGNGVAVASDHEQVAVLCAGRGLAVVRDSVVAGGSFDGLYVRADDQSTVRLTNLTVAANDQDGIAVNRVASSSAVVSLANTIAYANLALNVDIQSGPVNQTGNLIGIDPEFVDLQSLDLRFEVGSTAEDAGDPAPPGGLGGGDIRGGLRLIGAAPDVGAYEGDVSLLFSDGLEVDAPWRWSTVVGFPIF